MRLFKHLRWIAAGMLAAGLLAPMTGCSTNAATGRSQLNVMSRDQEVRVGQEAAPEFEKEYGGPIPDESIQQYVSQIGMRLAQVSERSDLPWEFHTIDTSVINAFALPGGQVFVSRGLMEKMTNEAQLAGVLGHEVGHVTAKHINDRMAQQMAVSGILVGLGVAAETSDKDYLKVLGVGAQVGGGLYLLKFSRGQELESDELGVRYMVRLGYDPMGQVQVMEILNEASGGGGIEMLQTHPLPESRIEDLRELIETKYAHTQNNPDYVLKPEAFQNTVLAKLKKLPAPKHNPE